MIQRLVPVALIVAGLAACAAPSPDRFYPAPGTPYASIGGPIEYEAAPTPVELPDPAATRDAPRGPPPLPTAPVPMLDMRDPALAPGTSRPIGRSLQ
ncbi:MAG: hypothetical protein AB7O45_09300 [Alphaproteobacteria bacterium]